MIGLAGPGGAATNRYVALPVRSSANSRKNIGIYTYHAALRQLIHGNCPAMSQARTCRSNVQHAVDYTPSLGDVLQALPAVPYALICSILCRRRAPGAGRTDSVAAMLLSRRRQQAKSVNEEPTTPVSPATKPSSSQNRLLMSVTCDARRVCCRAPCSA